MLKPETMEELEDVFSFETEISEFIPEKAPHVETVNLDLVRIWIYDRIHPQELQAAVVEILKNNDEPGPLNIHIETASSCRLVYYIDISSI